MWITFSTAEDLRDRVSDDDAVLLEDLMSQAADEITAPNDNVWLEPSEPDEARLIELVGAYGLPVVQG